MAGGRTGLETLEEQGEDAARRVRGGSGFPTACQRGPFRHPWKNTAQGLALHRRKEGLLFLTRSHTHTQKLFPLAPLRYVHCLPPPPSSPAPRNPPLWTGTFLSFVPSPPVRRAFKAPSVSPRSAVFRPCQFSVPPSVDDRRSCDAAAAASVKMVVSCLHNGSGVRRRAQAGTGPVSRWPNRSVNQPHPHLHHPHVASSKKTQNTLF